MISGGTLGKTTTLMNLESFDQCSLDIDLCWGTDCPNVGHMRAGLLGQNFPILCSGLILGNWQHSCQVWGYETPVLTIPDKVVPMIIQWDNDSIWLSGGDRDGAIGSIDSVIVSFDGVTPGPDLPYSTSEYCIVKVNDDLFAIMGGEEHHHHMRFFNKTTNAWSPGPDLLIGHRKRHVCGVFQIKGTQYIALIGGMAPDLSYLDKVEFFNMRTNSWEMGKVKRWSINIKAEFYPEYFNYRTSIG